jgi:hypothetical protein
VRPNEPKRTSLMRRLLSLVNRIALRKQAFAPA